MGAGPLCRRDRHIQPPVSGAGGVGLVLRYLEQRCGDPGGCKDQRLYLFAARRHGSDVGCRPPGTGYDDDRCRHGPNFAGAGLVGRESGTGNS